ncbi:MAG TPA: hypothetical protein VJ873_05930, partial [bacterium]|nr:hypothetical protein [bacterium]
MNRSYRFKQLPYSIHRDGWGTERMAPMSNTCCAKRFHARPFFSLLVLFASSSAFFFLATCGNLYAQAWSPVGSTCFSLGSSHQQSVVSCNGKVYVAFDDKGSSPAGLSVMTYNGSNWVFVGASGFGNMTPSSSNTATGYPTLALDPATCQPYVSYLSKAASIVTVETYVSGAWVTLGTVNAATDAGPSLVLYNGTPYLSFGSGTAEYVEKWNGSSWVTVGSPIPVSDSTTNTSLTVDSATGTLYFTYGAGTSPVWKFNGTSWVQVGSPVSTGDPLNPQALKINNGVPYLAYSVSNNVVYVQMFNGTSWVTMGGGTVSSDSTEWPSMAFCCGSPVVAVDDETALNVGIFEYQNGSWVNVGAFPQGSGDVEHVSLFIDANCNAYVGYMDATCSNKTTVMHSPIPLACLSSPTPTPTNTATRTATATSTVTATRTSSSTSTATQTATSTATASFTATKTATSTATASSTATQTATSTATRTATSTATATSTSTASFTATSTFTLTSTRTASNTPTSSFTATASLTATATSTATSTATATFTHTSTASRTPSD